MKDGFQLIDMTINEVNKMDLFQQGFEQYSQEQILYALQQQLVQQIQNQQTISQENNSSLSTSNTLEESSFQMSSPNLQTHQRKFIIGGFGSNGYDSSSHAMEYLYDLLGENDQFEFFGQVKQSWKDIDNYINDLQEEINQNEKQGIETIYIHFTVNDTPFIRLEKCAYNNKAFIMPEMGCAPNDQVAHTIDINQPHNSCLQTYLSIDHINSYLKSDMYWTSESLNPGQNSNNYLYYHALQATNNKALLVNLPSLLNENKESISFFLQDFIKSLL